MASTKKLLDKQMAFLFFPSDFLTDTLTWTPAEVGYFTKLLCLQWINDGVDSDANRLAIAMGEGFLDAWQHIKIKFTLRDNGRLYNERLELERVRTNEYFETQSGNGKKGAEARWRKHSGANGETDGGANGNANSGANGETMHKNKNKNKKVSINIKDNLDGDANGTAIRTIFPAEKILITGGTRGELRLYLHLDDSYTSKEIEKLLLENLESLVMYSEVWKKPDDFIVFLFESFFSSKIAEGVDTHASKLKRDWVYWYNYNHERIERAYNQSKKDMKWFDAELKKHKEICKSPDQQAMFCQFYLRLMPSGKMYYQTLSNFDVKESLDRWVNKDFKVISSIQKNNKITVVPNEGSSIEQIKDFYALES